MLIATASHDKTARVWEVEGGQERACLKHFGVSSMDAQRTIPFAVLDVAFSPDGTLIATAVADKTARLWEVGGRELLRCRHDGHVGAVAFSPDGKLLATASNDKTARLWKAHTPES